MSKMAQHQRELEDEVNRLQQDLAESREVCESVRASLLAHVEDSGADERYWLGKEEELKFEDWEQRTSPVPPNRWHISLRLARQVGDLFSAAKHANELQKNVELSMKTVIEDLTEERTALQDTIKAKNHLEAELQRQVLELEEKLLYESERCKELQSKEAAARKRIMQLQDNEATL